MQHKGAGKSAGIGVALMALLMAGCNSSGKQVDVSGVAAIGAPLVGAGVNLRCDDGVEGSATTDSNGVWNVSLPADSLPCAGTVSGGTAGGVPYTGKLYSYIPQADGDEVTVHFTPLTSLAMAQAAQAVANQSPANWYASPTFASTLPGLPAAVQAAQSATLSALSSAGYGFPSGFNPFSFAFTAAAGDSYDDLLELYASAISAMGFTYADVETAFAAGQALPQAEAGGGGGGNPAPVVYDGTNYVPGNVGDEFRYQSEPCEGAYDVFARNLGALGPFLMVRIGQPALSAGTVSLPIAALSPGVGTTGPKAADAVQLYLYFGSDNQSWTDASSSGNVQVSFDGTFVRVVASNVLLKNGKRISFDLSARYLAPSACNAGPTPAQQAVNEMKQRVGSYPLRLQGGSCATPLAAANTGFKGTLVVDAQGGMTITDNTDATRKLAILPSDAGFEVLNPPQPHYQRGADEIYPLDIGYGLKVLEVKSGTGCLAYLRNSSAEPVATTADTGTGSATPLSNSDGASATVKGAATVYLGSVIATHQGDGTVSFRATFMDSPTTLDANRYVNIQNLPTALGKHDCSVARVLIKHGPDNLKDVYSTAGASTCVIEVLSSDVATGKVSGRFRATLTNYVTPSETITVTDGYFGKDR